MVLLATGLQLAAVSLLSPRHEPRARPPRPEAHLRLDRLETGRTALASDFERTDPTLFALVSERGFSGAAWLTVPPFDYRMTNAPEPLRWLTIRPEELADDLSEFVQTNLLNEDVIAGALPPRVAEPVVPVPVVVAGTVLRVEGELAGRRLLEGQTIPQLSEAIVANPTLAENRSNTVVSVLVDRSGRTVSAALLSLPNVLPAADELALKFAKAARFEPRRLGAVGAGQFEAGTLVFVWAKVRWEEPGVMAQRGKR
jgi:hypothetical protein